MSQTEIHHELIHEIDHLGAAEQLRLLEIVRGLKSAKLPKGTKWDDIQEFAGTISAADADEMRRAIEEGCEKIEIESW
jgi:hypothetical protein